MEQTIKAITILSQIISMNKSNILLFIGLALILYFIYVTFTVDIFILTIGILCIIWATITEVSKIKIKTKHY